MYHSFGPASGGTWAERVQTQGLQVPTLKSAALPISLQLLIFLSLSGGRSCAVPVQLHCETIRLVSRRTSSPMPIPDIFCLEVVTSCVVCGLLLYKPLLTQTEAFHNLAVPIRVPAVEIVQ